MSPEQDLLSEDEYPLIGTCTLQLYGVEEVYLNINAPKSITSAIPFMLLTPVSNCRDVYSNLII